MDSKKVETIQADDGAHEAVHRNSHTKLNDIMRTVPVR